MSTLRGILQRAGYSAPKIHGISQLLLIPIGDGTNVFSNFASLLTRGETIGDRERLQIKNNMALGVSLETFSPHWLQDTSLVWQNEQLIDDLLDHEFDLSEVELFKLLVALTQLQFILNSRFKVFSGTTNMYELDTKKDVSFAVQRVVQLLGFCNSREYSAADGLVTDIFLHAATESAMMPRLLLIEAMSKQLETPIRVHYATNPRGLSKSESSTAEILSRWFTEESELQPRIASHIRAIFSDKSLKVDWYSGLNQLRAILLDSINATFSLGLAEFPSAPGGEVYPPIYDQTAVVDGNRDPLNNRWPHVGHLLNYCASKLNLDPSMVRLNVIPVPGTVVDGKYKPAQTTDLVKAFFSATSSDVNTGGNKLYCVSDNSVSNGADRQHLIVELQLKKMGSKTDVITYHDALDPKEIDFERITKEVAAQFYELVPHLNSMLSTEKLPRFAAACAI